VGRFGVEGLVMGTTISTLYMYIAYALYASRNIAKLGISRFLKRLGVTALCVIASALLCELIPAGEMTGYFAWIVYALQCAIAVLAATLIINLAFYGREMKALLVKLRGIGASVLRKG